MVRRRKRIESLPRPSTDIRNGKQIVSRYRFVNRTSSGNFHDEFVLLVQSVELQFISNFVSRCTYNEFSSKWVGGGGQGNTSITMCNTAP